MIDSQLLLRSVAPVLNAGQQSRLVAQHCSPAPSPCSRSAAIRRRSWWNLFELNNVNRSDTRRLSRRRVSPDDLPSCVLFTCPLRVSSSEAEILPCRCLLILHLDPEQLELESQQIMSGHGLLQRLNSRSQRSSAFRPSAEWPTERVAVADFDCGERLTENVGSSWTTCRSTAAADRWKNRHPAVWRFPVPLWPGEQQ